jgi:hypothetical protein
MNNQSGQILIEFMIAISITFGLFILFFALTYTFSTIEVAQYVVFSATRAQSAGNMTAAAAKAAGAQKLNFLVTKNTGLAPMFNPNWFEFGANPDQRLGNALGGTFSSLAGNSGGNYLQSYTGMSVPFVSNLLSMGVKVPFISGGNSSAAATDSSAFSTHINVMMIREPAIDECQQFWSLRVQQMKKYGFPSSSGQYPMNPSAYYPTEDNGC